MRELSVNNLHAASATPMAVLLAMAAVALIPQRAAAQSAVPEAKVPIYDVVSIKPNKTGSGDVDEDTNIGNFVATNLSLKALVLEAYSLKESQLFGLPKWDDSARFDIQAKIIAPDKKLIESLTQAQRRSMLRPILTNRFHLKFHHESKILPVYELVLVKGGPKFRTTTAAVKANDTRLNGVRPGGFSVHNTSLTATGVPLSDLADFLSGQTRRVVIDKTGLPGKYNLLLEWTPNDAPPSASADALPGLFTALEEQLGLHLKPAKANIQTFVIDHVEMPSEN